MKPDQINWTSISITWLRRWIHARARRVPVRDLMFVYTAYIGTGCWQFHPCERSSRTMHPGQNNSLGPLWSVRDKSFIIDLRLIVTLWITRVCTVWYALAYTPAFSYRLASVCRFSLSLSLSRRRLHFTFSVCINNSEFPSLTVWIRSIAHLPANANRTTDRIGTSGNSWCVAFGLLGGFLSVWTKMNRIYVPCFFPFLCTFHADRISRSKRIDVEFLLNRRGRQRTMNCY